MWIDDEGKKDNNGGIMFFRYILNRVNFIQLPQKGLVWTLSSAVMAKTASLLFYRLKITKPANPQCYSVQEGIYNFKR